MRTALDGQSRCGGLSFLSHGLAGHRPRLWRGVDPGASRLGLRGGWFSSDQASRHRATCASHEVRRISSGRAVLGQLVGRTVASTADRVCPGSGAFALAQALETRVQPSLGIGAGIVSLLGHEVRGDVLQRIAHGSSLTGSSREQRQDAIRQSFVAMQCRDPVILVDDVCTTGATASTCRQVLEEAGCQVVGGIWVGLA